MELRVLEAPGDFIYVALEGRLDLAGVQAVQPQFTSRVVARKRSTAVDVSGVTFLASLGMRMLVEAARTVHRVGGRLVLLRPQQHVREALEMAGLAPLLPVASSEAEAFSLLGSA